MLGMQRYKGICIPLLRVREGRKMKVQEALLERKSVRAFADKTVEKEKIVTILEHAKHAPSGVNMQPWRVCVVSGRRKRRIEERTIRAFGNGTAANMDYRYYPDEWVEPYRSRRKAVGLKMYSALGIGKEERTKMAEQWKANYRAFDAPVALYFFLDRRLATGSFLDYGMFLQSVMLAATELGLGSCPQAALAEYPDIVREELGIGEEQLLVCGMALGYEEPDAAINGYRTERIPLEEFVTFHEE